MIDGPVKSLRNPDLRLQILEFCGAALLLFVSGTPAYASPEPTGEQARWIQFSGRVVDGKGQPVAGTIGITFAIYKDAQGGNPLWRETQNVFTDEQGIYSVFLGSEHERGLPLEIFASREARWIEAQVLLPGFGATPRVELLHVPYALKAGDADTLGGKPASDYVLADSLAARSSGSTQGGNERGETVSTSLPDASPTESGLVNTSQQMFAGTKIFMAPPAFNSSTPGSILLAGAGGIVSEDNPNLVWDGLKRGLNVGPRTGFHKEYGQFYVPISRNFVSLNKLERDGVENTLASISEDHTSETLTGFYSETESKHETGTKAFVNSIESDVYVNAPSPAITNLATGLKTYVSNGGSGTINSSFGIHVTGNDNWGGGSVLNNYGIKVENQAIAGADNWAIRTGAGKVQFGDTLEAEKNFFAAQSIVPSSAELVFDAALANSFKATLGSDVRQSTILNGSVGQIITLLLCQDETGNHYWTWP